ncbi:MULTISPECIES: hypothetical protein [unclassified Streptomyces]|uniref:hypothetical protein n=1 Tax=unclassified Streptomyces TaxID=2593676 RepID=UPI000B589284|nr:MULTISPECIES: hypothetical protein [unclassified Streptomyces]
MERTRPRRPGHRHPAPPQRTPPHLGHPHPEDRKTTTEPPHLPASAPADLASAGAAFDDDVLAKLAELEQWTLSEM